MYRSDPTRERLEAAAEAELVAVADRAWHQCAAAARVLMGLRHRPEFHSLVGDASGLLEELPAMLTASRETRRADAVLQLAVARATLRPWLARVDVLGWLAHAHPESLVVLLNVTTGDEGAWLPTGEPPAPADPPPRRKRRTRRRP